MRRAIRARAARSTLRALLRDCSGATMIEYGLLVAVLSTIIVFGAFALQQEIVAMYGRIVAVF